MAQVKKFQPGGKLTISGKDYTIDQLNEYMNSGGFSSQERAALAGTIQSIAGGASRTFDRNANSISGEGVTDDFTGFYGSEKRAERNQGKSTRWANRQARRNSDHHIVNSALEKLGGIEDYYNSNKKSKDDKNTNNVLRKGTGFFKYDDESGEYLDNAENFGYMDLITRGFNYLKGNRDDWDTSAFSESELNWLHDWYNKNVGYESGLRERIKSGQLKDTDRNLLSVFGLSQNQIEDLEQKQQKRFQTAKYDYSEFRPYFDVNENGQLIARTIDGKSVFSPFGGNGNYWFNEQFVKNNPQYSFLKDHFLINGVLHKQSSASDPNSDLYKYLHQPNGFYDLNKKGDWVEANEIIRQYWDGQNHTNYALASESPVTSDYFKNNPGIRWASVTGAYDVNLNPGEQLLEVYDPSEQTDILDPKTKLIVLDSEGNYIRDIDNNDPRNLTGNKPQEFTGRKVIRQPGSIYDGMEVHHPTNGGITFYWDPKTKRLVYEGEMLNATNTEGKNYAFPSEIAEILMSNPKFIDNLLKLGKLSKFKRTLGATINTGVRDWTLGLLADEMDVKDWKELGFVEEGVAEKLQGYFDDLKKNNRYGSTSERRHTRLIDMQKMGGKMRYISKFQPGGTIGTTETKAFTERKIDGPVKDTRNFANIGDDPFTVSDWLELGGLATDLVSLGVGFSGAPIASGVVGAIGSTASFASDINRDGLDWGDVGNYALNLGLDLVSAIPFAGGAAQSLKAAGKIKKAAKTVGKFLSNPWVVRSLAGMGIGNAVKISAEKIINGEEWNVRDIRNVANGLSGIMALRKTGLAGRGVKKQDVGEINVKIKDNDIKVKLEEADLKRIAEASKDDTDKVLREIIKEKYPKIGKSKTKTSDINFSPAKIEEKLGLKFWKGKQPTGEYDFQLKTETVAPEFTKEGLSKGGNQLQDRFNHYLRTGEWKTLDDAGNVIDATDQLQNALKARRPGRNGRKLLREASFVLPNVWSYSEQEPRLQPGFVAAPVINPYANHFKDGGKIQFAKNGTKITKHQDTSKLPDPMRDPATGKLYSEMTDQEWLTYEQNLKAQNKAATKSTVGFNFSDLTKKEKKEYKKALNAAKALAETTNSEQDFIYKGYNLGKVGKSTDVPRKTTTLPTGISKLVDNISAKNMQNAITAIGGGTPWKTPVRKTAKQSTMGSVTGSGSSSNWLKTTGNILGVGAKGGAAWYASKRQMDLVNDMKPFQEQQAPEHSFRYRDSGVDLAYDKAIGQHQNYARNFKSSDPALNSAVGLQTADKTAQLELEKGLSKAQYFGEQQAQHQNSLQQDAQSSTGVVNRNAERANQMDAYKGKMKSAHIAQDQGIAQGVIDDIAGIGQQATAGKKALAAFDAKNTYSDNMSKLRTQHQTGINNGSIASGTSFDDWAMANHKKDIRSWQRDYLAAQQQYKKGGRIRPASEQIKIDNEKARHKAIAQLSKQAFELLKMALK